MSSDPVERIRLLRKAFELDPGRGMTAAQISQEYATLGAKEETLAWARVATEASPTDPWAWSGSMFALIDIEETDLAMNYAKRALELDPGNRFALRELGAMQIAAGNAEAALRLWQVSHPSIATREVETVDMSNHRIVIDLAVNLLQAGETGWAHELLDHLLQKNSDGLQTDPYYRVLAYALLGRRDEVLEVLQSTVDGSNPILEEDAMLLTRPEFGFLRDDPEFQAILEGAPQLDRQGALRRLRELERNGEIPPAPDLPT
jgi:tetratricopeptide (TPR) repeat protein